MPKRRNPFGEITPLQRKMHVGFEQMATEQERQEVYGERSASVSSEYGHLRCVPLRVCL